MELLIIILIIYIIYKVADALLPWVLGLILLGVFINFIQVAIPIVLGGIFLVGIIILILTIIGHIIQKNNNESPLSEESDSNTTEEKDMDNEL